MNAERKTGALIVLVAVVLAVAALVCSDGWRTAYPLWLINFVYQYGDYSGEAVRVVVLTKYVVALLVLVAGYGIARFFALIPPIFIRRPNRDFPSTPVDKNS